MIGEARPIAERQGAVQLSSMKRIRRWAFTLASFISLLVCILAGIEWVRSHYVRDVWHWRPINPRATELQQVTRYYSLTFHPGSLQVSSEPISPEIAAVLTPREFTHFVEKPLPAANINKSIANVRTDLKRNQSNQNFRGESITGYGFGRFGFIYLNFPKPDGAYLTLYTPLWAIVSLTALLPFLWLWNLCQSFRFRNRNWQRKCVKCGYDLRATPDRCPECGAIPPEIGEVIG